MSKIRVICGEFGENRGKSLDFFVKICYTISNIAMNISCDETSGKENGDEYDR